MYSYYSLAALGPHMQPYLWWKRYLTQLQIGQFVVLFLHSVYFVSTQEGYSAYYKYNYGFNTVVYLVLFSRFYLQTYTRKGEKAAKESVSEPTNELDEGGKLAAMRLQTNGHSTAHLKAH